MIVDECADCWFRYVAQRFASADEFDRVYVSRPELRLERYEVLRRTPKGVWLKLGFDDKKFVLLNSHKRWACPTEPEALASFVARKQSQIRILSEQLRRAEEELECADTNQMDAPLVP